MYINIKCVSSLYTLYRKLKVTTCKRIFSTNKYMSLKFVFFVIGMVAVSLGSISAYSDDDRAKIYANMLPHILMCSSEYGITDDKIKSSKEAGQFESINPCFMGCIFRKINVITDEGMFSVEKAEELSDKFLVHDEDKKKASAVIKACAKVNDESVSDGEKGCDRAKLLFDCLLPFRQEFIKTR